MLTKQEMSQLHYFMKNVNLVGKESTAHAILLQRLQEEINREDTEAKTVSSVPEDVPAKK